MLHGAGYYREAVLSKPHVTIFSMHTGHHHPLRYFAKNLSIVIGLVLIWRGIWYVLDGVDIYLLGDPTHTFSALGGILLGLLILYVPDHDLKELQKL